MWNFLSVEGGNWCGLRCIPYSETRPRSSNARPKSSTSGGCATREVGGEVRPVIRTELELMGRRLAVDITLTNRDAMGYRMLLGWEALRRRFVVDAGRSYLAGKPDAGQLSLIA